MIIGMLPPPSLHRGDGSPEFVFQASSSVKPFGSCDRDHVPTSPTIPIRGVPPSLIKGLGLGPVSSALYCLFLASA